MSEAVALHCYRHPDRQTYVSCTRCGRPICPECMRPASVGFHCPEDVAQAARGARAPRTAAGAPLGSGGPPVATYVLIGLNVAVFLLTAAGGTSLTLSGGSSPLYDQLGLIPVAVAHGQYYRLLTAMFLHFGLLHIATNMYALYIVGPPLERVLRPLRYVGLYLVAGLAGSAASFMFGPPFELAAGASGAIFGLFGALLIVARRLRLNMRGIVTVIAINLAVVLVLPVDIRAHLGGLIGGALIAAGMLYAPAGRYRPWVQAACLVAVLAVSAAMVAAHAPALTAYPGN